MQHAHCFCAERMSWRIWSKGWIRGLQTVGFCPRTGKLEKGGSAMVILIPVSMIVAVWAFSMAVWTEL